MGLGLYYARTVIERDITRYLGAMNVVDIAVSIGYYCQGRIFKY